jgi:hypothetical protein
MAPQWLRGNYNKPSLIVTANKQRYVNKTLWLPYLVNFLLLHNGEGKRLHHALYVLDLIAGKFTTLMGTKIYIPLSDNRRFDIPIHFEEQVKKLVFVDMQALLFFVI